MKRYMHGIMVFCLVAGTACVFFTGCGNNKRDNTPQNNRSGVDTTRDTGTSFGTDTVQRNDTAGMKDTSRMRNGDTMNNHGSYGAGNGDVFQNANKTIDEYVNDAKAGLDRLGNNVPAGINTGNIRSRIERQGTSAKREIKQLQSRTGNNQPTERTRTEVTRIVNRTRQDIQSIVDSLHLPRN